MFSLEERREMVGQEISLIKAENDARGYSSEIEVTSFNSLLMHFVDEHKAKFVIRGLRAVSDFEYEFQMVGMNARLNPDVETLFLMSSERHQFISSRLVKEIAILGGEIDDFVSSRVKERMLVNIKRK
jgi:pantetheine-phosphate adenylyltransferase